MKRESCKVLEEAEMLKKEQQVEWEAKWRPVIQRWERVYAVRDVLLAPKGFWQRLIPGLVFTKTCPWCGAKLEDELLDSGDKRRRYFRCVCGYEWAEAWY